LLGSGEKAKQDPPEVRSADMVGLPPAASKTRDVVGHNDAF
jgi:hypothetical protein